MEGHDNNDRRRLPARIAPKLLAAVAVLVFTYLSLCAGFYWVMRQPPDFFGRVMARTPSPLMMFLPFESLWTHARAGVLHPGDPAPDFSLPTLDRKDTVRLSSFRGSRPVVLVFGSYT